MFSCYESFEEYVNNKVPPDIKNDLLLQYKILFRKKENIPNFSDNFLNSFAFIPEICENNYDIKWKRSSILKMKDIVSWNIDYYDSLNHSNCIQKSTIVNYYTDKIENEKNVIDVFFCGHFPMLNITKFDNQMNASKKLKEYNYHLILDEVGTGKTVSALYCIRNILEKNKFNSKILVLCPNNKKNEWQLDLCRQLGVYAHIVANGNETNIYFEKNKELYFHNDEPCIFIEAQKKDQKNDELNIWSSNEKWDLVVIDEGHLCFSNYDEIRTNKAIILTATPLVINASNNGYSISQMRQFKNYINLLEKITNTQYYNYFDNLFCPNSYFSQFFREDLGIQTKKRNIEFIKCKRLNNRNEYLNILSDVKGEMTKLIYEQDDDYILHSIYDDKENKGFRNEIEGKGYLIDNKKPIIINEKYNELKNIINKKNKSYIVFFNNTWPAKNIYNKLLNDFNGKDIIIALKFGGKEVEIFPKDFSVNNENIFDYLQSKIRIEKKKVVFITTGASGGTGLNLGDFDGVINYELPFTCIELEQRFGRVDRMDKSNSSEKDMIFLINDDYNPMLRYSTIKLHATCLFMPIRNTVLFYPDFIDANNFSLKNELLKILELNDLNINLSDIINKKFNRIINVLKQINSEKGKTIASNILRSIELKKSIDDIVIEEDTEHELRELYKILEEPDSISNIFLPLLNIYNYLPTLKSDIKEWGSIIIPETVNDLNKDPISYTYIIDENSETSENIKLMNNDNEYIEGNQIIIEKKHKEDKINIKDLINYFSNIINSDIQEMQTILNLLDQSSVGNLNQEASGVFYIEKNNDKLVYHRKTINEYRKIFNNKKE